MGGRCDATGDGTVMYVDRAVQIQDARRVGHFAVHHTQRDDDASLLDRLAIYHRLVLVHIATEETAPHAWLTQVHGPAAAGETIAVEHADVSGSKAAGLQRLHRRGGMRRRVEDCHNSLVCHLATPSMKRFHQSPSPAPSSSRPVSS